MFKKGMIATMLLVAGNVAWAASLGDAADGLYQPVSVVTMMMGWACYVVGTAVCIGAVMQFRIHLQNPKLTPLMTPLVMMVVGVILILLPYFSLLPGDSWSAQEQDERDLSTYKLNTQEIQEEEAGGGSHWSTDPRYKTKP